MSRESLSCDDPDEEKLEQIRVSENGNKIEIPDGGFKAWGVVVAFFLYNISTWGANAGFSVYLAEYLKVGRFSNAGSLDYAAIGGLAFGAGLFFAPAISYFVHVTSAQLAIAVGITLQCAGLLLAAFSANLWELYLTQGVLISFGLAFISIPSVTLVPQWFRYKRNLAQGIAAAGSGAGGILFNLGMEKVMRTRSVKWALIVQCILCTTFSCIALSLTRTRLEHIWRGKKPKFTIFDLEILRSWGYWFVVMYISMTILGYVVLLYSMSAFTVSLGYTQEQGSIVSCMISVGALVGRPFVGFAADRLGPVTVCIASHMIVVVFCLAMWIPCQNFATALIFSLIVGLFMGSIWSLIAPIVGRVVGLPKLNVCMGMLWTILSACGITAPIIGLVLRDENNSTGNDFIRTAVFAGMMYFGSVIALWFLRALLIARDEIAMEAKTGSDDGELHLQITFNSWVRGLFKVHNLPRQI
ncbi:LAQU0S14e00892g1_1 [Lachancea quebecensis]|uniref:LAQU0S14e00892g1_1 n=1 Tax=Lachancea quebecensis TaxID=1654605 RepID=A0A0P1KV45_9SACH|nr:LAQU0S14e00892g1_1 [Lachancea quebecensis]